MKTWERDYILGTLDAAELFAHQHKGQSPDDFEPDVGNWWLELCQDLDALLGCYEDELEGQVKLRIEKFLKGDWLRPQSLAKELDLEEKTKEFLEMSDEEYEEYVRQSLEEAGE